jgi:hypothetical protein
VLYAVTCYLLMCVALFLLQRKLIYPAGRTTQTDPALYGFPPQVARNITAGTSDGVRLGGWHLLPRGKQGADFDAALAAADLVDLFFHGNGGHRGHRGDVYQAMMGFGLHVVAFDYRGYGDSQGSPCEEGLALDARAAWNRVVRQHRVPPGRVVLHGESLGCAVAVRLAAELCLAATPPAGLILESPFASLMQTAGSLYWFLPVRLMLRERYPSAERIEAVTCPILVFHGRRDAIVKFEHGRKLFDAAPAVSGSGVPKRFVELAGAGHNDLRGADAVAYQRALKEFLEACRQRD